MTNRGAAGGPSLAIEAAKLLDRAIERIGRGWTQGAYARDADGDQLDSSKDRRAVCWCATGGLYAELSPDHYGSRVHAHKVRAEAEHAIVEMIGGRGVIEWNDSDGQTAEHVADVMRQAADRLRDSEGDDHALCAVREAIG